VDPRVKRLNEVNVGDDVTADYYVSLAGELRAPTEEEKEHPLTILDVDRLSGVKTFPFWVRRLNVRGRILARSRPDQAKRLKGTKSKP